jgi:hypothetical protein
MRRKLKESSVPDHITHDSAYETVDRDDFASLIEVDRYNQRSDAFEEIISATVDHFWDPGDARYVDFQADFALEAETLMPSEFFPEFNCEVADKLDDGQKIALSNELTRFSLSQILHGEQGAMSLSASLCEVLWDPGAQEYAANQVREEARHVNAFGRYIAGRWGTALPCGEFLASFLTDIIHAPEVYKKLVGMQLMIEGFASLPPQVRPHLVGAHDPEAQRRGAHQGRGLVGADLPGAARKPRWRPAEARHLPRLRSRLEVGGRRHYRVLQ